MEVPLGSRAASSARRPLRRRLLAILGVLAAIIVVLVLAASRSNDDDGERTDPGPASSTVPGTIDPALVLERGDEGEEVREIQRWLRDSGTDPDLRDDGLFGPLTDRAVRMFEDNNELAVDGRLVIEGDEWRQLQAAAEAAQSSTASTTSSTTTDGTTPVPDVYRLTEDSAVQELEAAGFEVDVDAGCSNSVDTGFVRQVSYRDDGTKIVVVGTTGEIDARDAPAGMLLSVLVSTGTCP
jgi:peptidoglycan hydrolase-like protein with peptidoglycan-binding domain